MRKKRMISAALALCLALSLSLPAFAAKTASEAATTLHALGLFQGKAQSETGEAVFALGDRAVRAEAVTMLVRLLGREAEAQKGVWSTPFTDVPDWAAPYVGYAYENGLTRGQSATIFGSEDAVLSNDYLTLLLRALGYTDESDFTWETAHSVAATLGLGTFAEQQALTRGDVARASFNALSLSQQDGTETLLGALLSRGAVTNSMIEGAGMTDALGNGKVPPSDNGAATTGELTATKIYAKCSPAVFSIEIFDAKGDWAGSGSGFFISQDGKAVTNYHVIEDGSSAKITLADGKTTYDVRGVYDYDVVQDVALLQIDGTNFPYLTPATSALTGGQTIYTLGSPMGLSNTISQGIVSNPDREIQGVHYIQISAAISSGSSGGALLNTRGEVVGVTSAGYSDGQNLNFAVAYTEVQALTATNLRTFSEILREVGGGVFGVFRASAETVSLKVGDTATVTLHQSYPTASTIGYDVSDLRVANLRWGDWAPDGGSMPVTITGRSVGSTTIAFYLYGKNDAVLAQTTVRVTVTA